MLSLTDSRSGVAPSRVRSIAAFSVLACAIGSGGAIGSGSAIAGQRVEVILDVSGSMAATAEGQRKIDAARVAVARTMAALPADAVVALRLYGHRVSKERRDESCRDSELVLGFGSVDRGRIQSALDAAVPRGQTPLAYSLELAAADFATDEPAVVVLVSDGEETCGADPVAAAKALVAKGIDLTVHTVGFDVGADARTQLEQISRVTRGEYRDARSAAELADSISELARRSVLIDKSQAVTRVRGGNSYESAVPVALGQRLRLDHHQRKGEFDYFSFDAAAGQGIRVAVEAPSVGVTIRADAARSGYAFAGAQIRRARGNVVAKLGASGSLETDAEVFYVSSEAAGRYYLLVGSTGYDMSEDAVFSLEPISYYDASSATDAGETDLAALTIDPGDHSAYFIPGDRADVYRIVTKVGDTVAIRARAREASLRVAMTDADGVRLAQGRSPNHGAAVRVGVEIARAGDVFVTIETRVGVREPQAYELSIERTPRTPAAADGSPVSEPARP